MAAPVIEAPPPRLRSARQALLIIHGIGEQDPYETLDSFARGVFTHLTRSRGLNAKLCPIEIAHEDWVQVGMRIGFFAPHRSAPPCPEKDAPPDRPQNPSDQPAAYVDLFEYYWAPLTEDKLNAVDTLKWVLQTDFTPLKYFADNLQEMIGAYGMKMRHALREVLAIYGRELARVFFLYSALAVGVLMLLAWIAKPHDWGAALANLTAAFKPYLRFEHAVILLCYAAFLLMAWFGLQSLFEIHRQSGTSIEQTAERVWFALDAIVAAAFLALALWLDLRPGNHALAHAVAIIRQKQIWEPLGGAAIAGIVSYALTAYVADVAVYVNTDAKSEDYAAHSAILKGSTAALKMLLASGSYDRVILAGHSLGSVIAYDTINGLLAERNAQPGQPWDTPVPYLSLDQLQKLKGLVTFGSPLDKVFYFFRQHVKRDQAIRAQILSMLYSFRRAPSGRTYGQFEYNYAFRQLDGDDPLVWLNAWASMDPVSGELKFYLPDDQREFPYALPVLAHLSYWGDPNFYEYFCGRLL